jgi:hypothetical protein
VKAKSGFRLEVSGHVWEFFSLTKSTYQKKFGRASAGIADGDARTVHFSADQLTIRLIIHELIHVLVFESNTASSNLSAEQMEEAICDIVANNFSQLLNWAMIIYDKLK